MGWLKTAKLLSAQALECKLALADNRILLLI